MAKAEVLSPALLRQLLEYDPGTGTLTWRERTPALMSALNQTTVRMKQWNACFAGREGFTADNGRGYRISCIGGKMLRAHRVAWAIYYGEWPDGMLDHVNGDRADNRIANLRIVDFVENGRNARISSANRSGQTGVWWRKANKKWEAVIKAEGRRISLGLFDLYPDAVTARKDAEKRYGFAPSHGRAR